MCRRAGLVLAPGATLDGVVTATAGWSAAEIESVLDSLPGVRRSVVVPGEDGFVAHLEGARAVGLPTVKARLAALLPPHMTVNRLVFHPRGLPLTPRGKLDARKLTP